MDRCNNFCKGVSFFLEEMNYPNPPASFDLLSPQPLARLRNDPLHMEHNVLTLLGVERIQGMLVSLASVQLIASFAPCHRGKDV